MVMRGFLVHFPVSLLVLVACSRLPSGSLEVEPNEADGGEMDDTVKLSSVHAIASHPLPEQELVEGDQVYPIMLVGLPPDVLGLRLEFENARESDPIEAQVTLRLLRGGYLYTICRSESPGAHFEGAGFVRPNWRCDGLGYDIPKVEHVGGLGQLSGTLSLTVRLGAETFERIYNVLLCPVMDELERTNTVCDLRE